MLNILSESLLPTRFNNGPQSELSTPAPIGVQSAPGQALHDFMMPQKRRVRGDSLRSLDASLGDHDWLLLHRVRVHPYDDLHQRFALLCAKHGRALKDMLYEEIKELVESYEAFLEEQEEEERQKQEGPKPEDKKIRIKLVD